MEVFMVLDEFYKLNCGVRIPKVALGTWQTPESTVGEVVAAAIDIGYRHIDTAIAYENERGVGKGIKRGLAETGMRRESLFVTTKIPAEVKTYKEAEACILESMERLDCDFIDLMLIHAPKPWCEMNTPDAPRYYAENLEVWRALEDANASGKIRAIGVSNFDVDDLKNIMDNGLVMPAVNQVRVHVGHVPAEVIEFCQQNGVVVEAYSPNANGRLMDVKPVCEMAAKYGVSVPQLASRFCLQLGLLPLPKSTHVERVCQNSDLDFEIGIGDMAELLKIEEP